MTQSISTFLANDHGRLLGLFREFRELNDEEITQRKKRIRRFNEELKRHGKWVGSVLLPCLQEKVDDDKQEDLNDFLKREQHGFQEQIDAIIEKLKSRDPDTQQEEETLLSSLKTHFTKEEKILYPMFDQYLDEEEQETLIDRFTNELGNRV